MDWKDSPHVPFANYDLVVYFGCGLFSLPLIYHYVLEPTGFRFPRFQFGIGIPVADAVISTLSLLFSVYLLGHMIAYAGSLIVEKGVDNCLGKISSAILIANTSGPTARSETIQAWIADRITNSFRGKRKVGVITRAIILMPVLPILLVAFYAHSFDYFNSRIPIRVFQSAKKKCLDRGYGRVSLHTKWYKAIEHDIINNFPVTTARMYNYLIISGIFRSLALLFLFCTWAELVYLARYFYDAQMYVRPLMSDQPYRGSSIAAVTLYNLFFFFCLSAYLKFSRRYAEEAIFAFALDRAKS